MTGKGATAPRDGAAGPSASASRDEAAGRGAPVVAQVVEADWTWTGERFEKGIQVGIESGGRIATVGPAPLAGTRSSSPTQLFEPAAATSTAPEPGPIPGTLPTQLFRLPGRALLPGFVTAHSHAFQRALRGRGETFPTGTGSFWSWRQAMYDLVARLEPDEMVALTTRAFREMRAAGFTTVGEFHYLHHKSRAADARDYAFDPLILEAAERAGVRLVLIQSYYRTGAVGRPLAGAQRRFRSPNPEVFWAQVDRLAPQLRAGQTLAASVHSLRAGDPKDLAAVYGEARRRGLPFHIHVEEQVREVEQVMAAYHRRPMRVLLDTLGTAEAVTAVHCTHTDPADMERFAAAGGTVCLCPLTEGNLGDGIADVRGIRQSGARLAIGTDSNARLSPIEEMRWMEYGQRLATQSRGLLRDEQGEVGRVLLHAATEGGAQALGVDAGRIAPGAWADFAAIDLGSPLLDGWTPETLLDSLIFGATEAVVAATCVGGRWEETTPCVDATR